MNLRLEIGRTLYPVTFGDLQPGSFFIEKDTQLGADTLCVKVGDNVYARVDAPHVKPIAAGADWQVTPVRVANR